MNFEDIQKLEQFAKVSRIVRKSKDLKTASETDESLINRLIVSQQKKDYEFNPFEYFYEDVISKLLKFQFKLALGNNIYSKASDDAFACLETCERFMNLNPHKIHGWLMVALKFVDHFVVHYLQDIRKVVLKKISKFGPEKSRYIYLSKIDCAISKAGLILIDLYEIRNKELEHRTKTMRDGTIELLKPDRKSVYNEVIKYYPEVLNAILKEYEIRFPTYCLK